MVLAFYVLSGVTVGACLLVFVARNLLHAIVFLILAFLGMAGLFITLSADFVAVAQVLIYAGSISVLLVFAVMLTPLASRQNGNSLYVIPAVLLGAGFAAMVGFLAIDTEWVVLTGPALAERSFPTTVAVIGDLLLNRYVLAFEIASVLLLFALVGAIVLVHEDGDDDEIDAPEPSETVLRPAGDEPPAADREGERERELVSGGRR